MLLIKNDFSINLDISLHCLLHFHLPLLEKQLAIEPQARTFEAQEVEIDFTKYPLCDSPVLGTGTGKQNVYFIKREEKKIKDEKGYVYFAVLNLLHNAAMSSAYGTKDGTCRMGETLPDIGSVFSQRCGIEEHVLKYCFQDRGKEKKVPLQKPGFDPTKKGPYKWKISALAKEAKKHCDVMIHAKLIDPEDISSKGEKLSALHDISSAVEAAKISRYGKNEEKVFDTVFLDIKKSGKRKNMVITDLGIFSRVFRKNNPEFETRLGEFQLLLTRVLPEMFFCVCNGKCGHLVSQSDEETKEIFRNILKPPTAASTGTTKTARY